MKTVLIIDIVGDSPSNGWFHTLVVAPLADNVHVFVTLTYLILALLSMITAYRIYINWQAGTNDNIISDISKWFLGMVLCIVLITALKTWIEMNPVPISGVDVNFE